MRPTIDAARPPTAVTRGGADPLSSRRPDSNEREAPMSLLWIILIIVLVLVLLGFFGRGRF
jgi:hypothetical protein